MSNLVTTQTKLPSFLQDRIGKGSGISAAMSDLVSSGYPRISIRGGRWRIMQGSTETVLDNRILRAVIVGANPATTKSFYGAKYDPKSDPKGPDCFSMDGVRPSPDAEQPQSQVCATCPQNVWGSKQTEAGTKIKACLDQKRLAVIAAEDPGGPVYLLQVTPSALKGLGEYNTLLTHKGYPPECVITEVSFDPDASHPRMVFSFGGFVDEHTLSIVDELLETPKVLEVTGQVTHKAKMLEAPKQQVLSPVTVTVENVEVIKPAVEEKPAAAEKPKRGFGAAASSAASTPLAAHKEPTAAPSVQSNRLTDELKDILAGLDDE